MSHSDAVFIVGAILAGGLGTRLGHVEKANLKVGGMPLLARCDRVLRQQCDAVTLVAPHPIGGFAERISDSGLGPGEAIASALSEVPRLYPEATHLLTASVDSYVLPSDFAQKALSALFKAEAEVVIGQFDGQDYPVNALWRLAATTCGAKSEPKEPSGCSVRSLYGNLNTLRLDFSRDDGLNPFSNINTMRDLLVAQQHFRLQPDGHEKS